MAISKIYQFRVKISIKILPIFAVSGSKYWNFEPLLQFCHAFEPIRLMEVRKISIVALWVIFDSIRNAQILSEIVRFSTADFWNFELLPHCFAFEPILVSKRGLISFGTFSSHFR